MDIEVIVGPLLALFIFCLLKLSLNRLRRRLGGDISVKPIYLRSYDNSPEGSLKLKISNDSGHKVTINGSSLGEVNGKKVEQVGASKPFEIEDKGHKFQMIKFRGGKLREGKNNCLVILAVEDFKGRRVLEKRLSVFLESRRVLK